jgi:2-oxoisovalerate dehydrogenase E2 component (dihydrolipoyl transacylase)
MATIIVMPQLGESVAEGIIGKWLKNEGDSIEKDEPIVEVITDKVNAEIPSPVAGVLEKIAQPEGATVAVGQEIAIIGDGGQSEPAEKASDATAAPERPMQTATPSGNGGGDGAGKTPDARGDPSAAEASYGAAAAATQVLSPAGESGQSRSERVRSSPLVRRLADQYGISLAEVPGTGIGGRVSKHDILSFVEQRQQVQPAPAQPSVVPAAAVETEKRPAAVDQAAASTPAPAPPAVAQAPRVQPAAARDLRANEELIPVPALRKMIADRVTHSMFTIPHAVTNVEVDMTKVVRFRESKKDEFHQREGVPLSYVAFVVKATVEALKEFPMVNAEWAGDSIILKRDININVAVDAPDGLTTPVIHHADEKSLAGISLAIYDLAMRARDKKLKIEDMQGGTFTVNNTGALGSIGGVSIINYPQAGIVAFGAIVKRPVVIEIDREDLIAVRSMMNISFSFDHRLLDGGYASDFINAVKQKLENWSQDYPLY